MGRYRIALMQFNAIVGDVAGNAARLREGLGRARAAGAQLVLFPEMALAGYPAEDLLLRPAFLEANRQALLELAPLTRGLTAIVGFPDAATDVYNAAAILHDGVWVATYHKHYLPNYAVFDEDRYFRPGRDNPVFQLGELTFGVSICEDIWYPDGPPEAQAMHGNAQLLLNLSASPYQAGKCAFREQMLSTRAADNVAIVAFCNLVGGQDELVFDGGSLILGPRGEVLARAAQFAEDFVVADVDTDAVFRQRLRDPRRRKAGEYALPVVPLTPPPPPAQPPLSPHLIPPLDPLSEVYQALVTGTRDYVRKNGFRDVVLGLSGGIDSALVACIAADALGPEHVTGVAMPSRYNASISLSDAEELARRLHIRFMTVPIESVFQAYLETLRAPFAGYAPDTTEENLQARIRGNLLMAFSNKFGWLVLTTGNKSEMSVGYATLYGDMAGGFAVIKDVPKTLVYQLVHWRNARPDGPVVPERIITRPPSAELRPDQKDTDSLPPYEVLDPILQAYVEEDQPLAESVAHLGVEEALVRQVLRMVDVNEYKRRQAPPGVKITPRAFGKDRRLPITQKFRP